MIPSCLAGTAELMLDSKMMIGSMEGMVKFSSVQPAIGGQSSATEAAPLWLALTKYDYDQA
jgi:hypothetical protein